MKRKFLYTSYFNDVKGKTELEVLRVSIFESRSLSGRGYGKVLRYQTYNYDVEKGTIPRRKIGYKRD